MRKLHHSQVFARRSLCEFQNGKWPQHWIHKGKTSPCGTGLSKLCFCVFASPGQLFVASFAGGLVSGSWLHCSFRLACISIVPCSSRVEAVFEVEGADSLDPCPWQFGLYPTSVFAPPDHLLLHKGFMMAALFYHWVSLQAKLAGKKINKGKVDISTSQCAAEDVVVGEMMTWDTLWMLRRWDAYVVYEQCSPDNTAFKRPGKSVVTRVLYNWGTTGTCYPSIRSHKRGGLRTCLDSYI